MNAQGDVESRLNRLKLESAVIEQHNEKLENDKENASNKQAADTVVDSEVSDVIKLNQSDYIYAHAGRFFTFTQFGSSTAPPSVFVIIWTRLFLMIIVVFYVLFYLRI